MIFCKSIICKLQYIILFLSLSLLYSEEGHSHDHHGHHHDHSHGNHASNKGSIRGIVIDKITNIPKEFTSISIVKKHGNNLLQQNDNINKEDIVTGGITNNDGAFYITEIPIGEYEILIQYIGYKNFIIENVEISKDNLLVDVGTISVEPNTLLLESVSIVDSPIIEEVAKTTYPVAETARESGGSADEVLEQLPGLSVDMDGNITLRGNSNVTILIDGRKSKITLDMLNANMIDKVEVMTTPSAKYDPDGIAGIINIILIKNEYTGKTGKISFNTNTNENKNLSGSYNIFKNDFNLFSNFSYNQKNKNGEGLRKTWYIHQPTPDNPPWFQSLPNVVVDYTEMESKHYRHPENFNFKLGSEKYFGDYSMFAFDVTYIDHQGTDTSHVQLYQKEINNPSSIINTTTISSANGSELNYGLGYFYDHKDKGSSLSFLFDYDDHNEEETIEYINENLLSSIDDWGEVKTFSMDYSSPIYNVFPFLDKIFPNSVAYNNESIFEFGIKGNIEDDMHGLKIDQNPFIWNAKNDINSVYFNASYYLMQSFGVQLGARFENQDKNFTIDFEELTCNQDVCIAFNEFLTFQGITDTTVFNYNHDRMYPSLYFIYNDNKGGTYKMGMGRRINRPGHWNLNPIPDLEDFNSAFINVGNPQILPEDIHKVDISYSGRTSFGFLKASVYADNVTNKMDRYKYTEIINSQEYQILTWTNIGESEGYGFDMTIMTRPMPKWDLMLYGNYWNNKYIEADDDDKLGEENGFWGMMTSKFKIDKKQQVSIYSHLSSPMKVTTGEIHPFKRMDISYRRKVSDKFSFTLKVKDIFDTGGFSIDTHNEQDISGSYNAGAIAGFPTGYSINYNSLNEYLDAEHRRDSRFISLNFEYKFGEFEKNKKYRRDGAGHGHSHSHDDGGMNQGF